MHKHRGLPFPLKKIQFNDLRLSDNLRLDSTSLFAREAMVIVVSNFFHLFHNSCFRGLPLSEHPYLKNLKMILLTTTVLIIEPRTKLLQLKL